MNVFQRIVYAIRSPALKRKRYGSSYGSITAASQGGSHRTGYSGIQSNRNEDELNKDYAHSLGEVLQRSQSLDVNNPDIGGFNRTRVAQCVGAGVIFEHKPHHEEIELSPDDAARISRRVNRLRQIHSRTGGFDSTGHGFSEGKQQERSLLTTVVNGACLIHRVWNENNPICPMSLELIPGVRISTPFELAGSPTTSYGVEYSDEHRTKIVGYHVRRVSKTKGDSFVPDYKWKFLPAEDCVLMTLTEQAGIDRALPLCTRVVRTARNFGEFIESSVEAARAQTKFYAINEVAEGDDPFNVAADDSIQTSGDGHTRFGVPTEGVGMLYSKHGEKITMSTAKLAEPDLPGFCGLIDQRMARGLNSSLSRYTRKVDSSWAGGRLEDQQDDPLVNQLRECFLIAWQRVNEWFLEALWLADQIDLPGYSMATRHFWTEFDCTFPGKVHINPVDTQTAREKGLMQRSTTPQRICKEDGLSLERNYEEWAQAYAIQDRIEKKYKLQPGKLDILFSGKAITSSAGEDIGAPKPEPSDPNQPNQTTAAPARAHKQVNDAPAN